MKLLILKIVFLLSFALVLYAEPLPETDETTGSINGYVRDEKNKEPIIGASVSIQGIGKGAYTNKEGFYSINKIKPGEYTVKISSLGYGSLSEKVTIKVKQNTRKVFLLKEQDVLTDEVTVEADRENERREITISKVNIPVQQIKAIRVGGESDVFRSLQFLPGILTSSQLSSGLFVRGGSPDQNLILLDGNVVYNPTHLFGFISTFNPEAIKDVELIKGGFPAEYGGRLSAVLNITQKEGNREEVDGLVSVGAISSRASLEGPLPWKNGSWFIGGRRTYFELIKMFIPSDPESPLPDFNFYDANAKITQDLGDNDKISLSGFLSRDNLNYGSYGLEMDLGLGNYMTGLRWTHIFGDNLFSSMNVSYSKYFNTFNGDQSGYGFLIDNSIIDYSMRGNLEWYTNENITHKFGFEVTNLQFKYLYDFNGDTDTTQSGLNGAETNLIVHDWNYAVYGQINYRIVEPLSLQAGLRVGYWDTKKTFIYDPRLALRYQINDDVAAKVSWGIFSQNLRLASSPDLSIIDTWLPSDSTVGVSSARHFIFSFETKPYEGFDLNFDVYYKKMYNISELNTTVLEGKTVSDLFYMGNAESYGAEVFLQRKIGRFTGWIGYAVGWISSQFKEINYGRAFRPKYDRRHDVKIVAQYDINKSWNVGGSFTFQSGQSYTGALSRFPTSLPGDDNDRGKMVPSQRYGLRLPPSHQLNLNGSYSFYVWNLPVKLIADIYNVYNRRDIWFRYYNLQEAEATVEDVKLLPIIPTLSIEVKF